MRRYRLFKNRLGCFALFDEDGELTSTWVDDPRDERLRGWAHDPALWPDLSRALEQYFDGGEMDFADAPTPAGSNFHARCWDACRSIPRGQTRSYADLAEMAGGKRSAARAAGQAMRHNPLPIIVPCHRVVAADGSLHGFAGKQDPACPDMQLKRALLELEGAIERLLTA